MNKEQDPICWECGEPLLGTDYVRRPTVVGDIWLHRDCVVVFENGRAEDQADARREEYYDNKQRL